MPRARHSRRQRRWSSALSAWSLVGLRRGRPRCLARTPGTASDVGTSMRPSCRFAPLSVRPGGVPRASVTRWRFVPGLPRSVGFGPTASPPFSRADWRCPAPPSSSPGHPRPAVALATPGAAPSRPRLRATRPTVASRSCRSSPARSAPRATECPFAARTRSPPALLDQAHAADRLSASAAPVATVVRPPPPEIVRNEERHPSSTPQHRFCPAL